MTTIDGRIDCPVVGQLSTEEYYIALDRLGKCSKLSGRVTAVLECSAVKEENVSVDSDSIGNEAYHIATTSDEYTIIVDTNGKIVWKNNMADGYPVLTIVSENVSKTYLDSLTAQGISWIATGKSRIDLNRAMELLHDKFGVERLAIVGGGHICGGFLEAGLVDEASVMIAPGIDGRTGQTAMFDGVNNPGGNPWKLRLETLEQFPEDIIWLRYKVLK